MTAGKMDRRKRYMITKNNKRNYGRRFLAAVLALHIFLSFSTEIWAASGQGESDIWESSLIYQLESPINAEAVKDGIKVSWKKNKKVKKYELYRKQAGTSKYKQIGTTKKNSFTDKKAKYGVTYAYKIRAIIVADGGKHISDFSEPRVCRSFHIDPSKPMVAVTYDDGPSQYTSQILDTLKKNNARATFFEVGYMVGRYPNAVKRIDEMGCELGNHSYDHANLGTADAAKVQSQLSRMDKEIKKLTGKVPELIRPPYGSIGNNLKNYAKRPLILWSIDTLDWKTRNAESVYQSVMGQVKDGDIILMHDAYLSTANASKRIIPELKKRGYQLVTVSELARYKKVTLRAGQKYFKM